MKPNSPKKQIIGDSVKFQQELSNRLSPRPMLNSPRGGILDSIYQSPAEMIQHRINSDRSPLSGMSVRLPVLDGKTSSLKSKVMQEMLRRTQRLNPSVLEAWLNNSITDAEQLGVNACILKHEHRLPLERYGVDRKYLLSIGIPSKEIDRIYRSLFVYSVGFCQMMERVLEHSTTKHATLASIWKVFAILLEYSCQFDYQLIINSISIEKNDELESLKATYQKQIDDQEEKEKAIIRKFNDTKDILLELQKELKSEVEKREELQQELLDKGSGHEDEMKMRLSFESKLNHMYANQRDMKRKMSYLTETIASQQNSLEEKSLEGNKKNKKILKLKQEKIEFIHRVSQLEENLSSASKINQSLENRLEEAYQMAEIANNNMSDMQVKYNEMLNDNSQKEVAMDDLRCEVELFKKQIANSEQTMRELKSERDNATLRASELEGLFQEGVKKYKDFELGLAWHKENDKFKTQELEKMYDKAGELEDQVKTLTDQKNSLTIHLEVSQANADKLQSELKLAQDRVEELNKARRIVEEYNEILTQNVKDFKEEHKSLNDKYIECREHLDLAFEKIADLETEVNNLNGQIQTNDKIFDSQKNTYLEKLDKLNKLIQSEKDVRQEWISKYEKEQHNHNLTTKSLNQAKEQLTDTQGKATSLTSDVDDLNNQIRNLTLRNENQLKELMNLRTKTLEYERKISAFEYTFTVIDQDHAEVVQELRTEIDNLKIEKESLYNNSQLFASEVWGIAHKNYEDFNSKSRDYSKLDREHNKTVKELEDAKLTIQENNRVLEGKRMHIEELFLAVVNLESQMNASQEKSQGVVDKLNSVTAELKAFKDLIPEELTNEPNPFAPLQATIKELKDKLDEIDRIKEQMVSVEVETDAPPPVTEIDTQTEAVELDTTEKEAQTDIGMSFFDKESIYSKSSKMIEPQASDFPFRQKINKEESSYKIDPQVSDSLLRHKYKKDESEGSKKIEPQNSDFNYSQKISRDDLLMVPGKDSSRYIQREDDFTPPNMKSVYDEHHSKYSGLSSEKSERSSHNSQRSPREKLPDIHKRSSKNRSPKVSHVIPDPMNQSYPSGPSQQIKRSIKQAISRRKNDFEF